jgi:hypothetical protein
MSERVARRRSARNHNKEMNSESLPLLYGFVCEILLRPLVKTRFREVEKEHGPTVLMIKLPNPLSTLGSTEELGAVEVAFLPLRFVPVSSLSALQKLTTASSDQVYVVVGCASEPEVTIGALYTWTMSLIVQIGAQASRFKYTLSVSVADMPDRFLCDHCGRVASVPLKCCGRCRVCRYCNAQCQLDAWPTHKPFCQLYQALLKG